MKYVRHPRGERYQEKRCGDWPFRIGNLDCADEFSTTGSLLLVCAVLDQAWREHDTDFVHQGYYDHYGDLFELDLPRLFAQYKTS